MNTLKVSLNNGGHQLRIYGKSDFSSDSVASNNNNNSNNNLIPAASLLVRLEKINEEDVLKFVRSFIGLLKTF